MSSEGPTESAFETPAIWSLLLAAQLALLWVTPDRHLPGLETWKGLA